MTFTYQDQIYYAKLALALSASEKTNEENLKTILNMGELIKKYADENNAVIYDVTGYIYEQLRLLKGEDGAYDDVALYQKLNSLINDP